MGKYSELAAGMAAEQTGVEPNAQPVTPDTGGGAYDELAKGMKQDMENPPPVDPTTHRTISETSTPESEAEILQLAEQARMPASLVRVDAAAAKASAERQQINDISVEAPKTGAFFSDSMNLAGARDDAPEMAEVERSLPAAILDEAIADPLYALARTANRAFPTAGAITSDMFALLWGAMDMGAQKIEQITGMESSGFFGEMRDTQQEMTRVTRAYWDDHNMTTKSEDTKGRQAWGDWGVLLQPEYWIEQTGDAAASMIPIIVATIASGGSIWAGGALGGTMEAGGLYSEMIENGVASEEAALGTAIGYGMVSTVLNSIGLQGVMASPMSRSMLTRLGKAVAAGGMEGLTEWAEEPVSEYMRVLGEGGTFIEALTAAGEGAKNVDVFFGAMISGGGTSFSNQRVDRQVDASRAEKFKEQQVLLAEKIANTKTAERNPVLMEKFLNESMGLKDQDVYIDAEVLLELQQTEGEAFGAFMSAMKIEVEDLQEAAKVGHAAKVNLGSFHARVEPEVKAKLYDHIKPAPGAYSVSQVEEGLALSEEVFEEQYSGHVAANEELTAEIDRLEQGIVAAGQNAEVAQGSVDSYVRMVTNFARLSGNKADVLRLLKKVKITDVLNTMEPVAQPDADGVTYAQDGSVVQDDAFRAWAKDTKVVDDTGKPLVVHHGQNAKDPISVFDPNRGDSFGGWNKLGTWFTADRKQAENFTGFYDDDDVSQEGNVYDVFLSIKNPWELDGDRGWAEMVRVLEHRAGKPLNQFKDEDVAVVREYLRASGKDGIIIRGLEGDTLEGADTKQDYYVVLNPEQIKSVNNQGTWDATNPNIYEQTEPTFTPADHAPTALPADTKGLLPSMAWKGEYYNTTAADLQKHLDENGDGFMYRVIRVSAVENGFDVGNKKYKHRFKNGKPVKVHSYTTSFKDAQNFLQYKLDTSPGVKYVMYRIQPQDVADSFVAQVPSERADGTALHIQSPLPASIDLAEVVYRNDNYIAQEATNDTRRDAEQRRRTAAGRSRQAGEGGLRLQQRTRTAGEKENYTPAPGSQFAETEITTLYQSYPDLKSAQRAAVDDFISKHPDGKRIRETLDRLQGSPWEKQAVESILIRIAMADLMAGRAPSVESKLDEDSAGAIRKALDTGGAEGLWGHLMRTGLIGHASKPVNSINGSFINCNPSDACAWFCYATGGNYTWPVVATKSEAVAWAIEKDPVRAAEIVAHQYTWMPEFEAKKALRLLDKGDMTEGWITFIEELNKKEVRVQVFSKRPALLRQIGKKNLRLLSVDSGSLQLADDNPDLGIAFTYEGADDVAYLESQRDRFEKHGGVILPVKVGQKTLPQSDIDALPAWAQPYACPVNTGKVKQLGKGNPQGWVCTKCDKNGGTGCYFGQTTADIGAMFAPLMERSDIDERIADIKRLAAELPGELGSRLIATVDSISAEIRAGIDPEEESAARSAAQESAAIKELYQTDVEADDFLTWAGTDAPVIAPEDINDFDFTQPGPHILQGFHGTTHRFNAFDATQGQTEGHFGAVNYFTSDEYDAHSNYVGEGPDLTGRIERRAEQIEENITDQYDEEEIRDLALEHGLDFNPELETYPTKLPEALAREELYGGDEIAMEVFIKTERPFVIGDTEHAQWVSLREIDEAEVMSRAADNTGIDIADIEADPDAHEGAIQDARWEVMEESPNVLVDAINEVASQYDIDPGAILNEVYENFPDGEANATDIEQVLRYNGTLDYDLMDENGDLIGTHVLSEIIQAMGYDSIIMKNADSRFPRMEMSTGTAHIHVFHENRTNIKSVDNRGTYSAADDNIYYQSTPEAAAPAFYSTLQRVADKPGMPTKAQALPNWLRKQGVKPVELQEMQVEQWVLDSMVDGKIDREAFKTYLAENSIVVEEKVLGNLAADKLPAGWTTEQRGNVWVVKNSDGFVKNEAPTKDGAIEQAIANLDGQAERYNDTQYSSYITPGGEDYVEVLLTLPVDPRTEVVPHPENDAAFAIKNPDDSYVMSAQGTVAEWETWEKAKVEGVSYHDKKRYTGSHFSETPNVMAWFRGNWRTDAQGRKMFFIEEIQSDWGQEAKKIGIKGEESKRYEAYEDGTYWRVRKVGEDGYITADGHVAFLEKEGAELAAKKENDRFTQGGVPSFPFRENWHELAMKKAIAYAVENGAESIGFTTGEQQADRYDLSRQIEKIEYTKNPEGTYSIDVDTGYHSEHDGWSENDKTPQELENLVGKEVASKIISGEHDQSSFPDGGSVGVLENLDLKVGGKGMKSFYDEKLPGFLKKYLKKWGSKVEDTETNRADIPQSKPTGEIKSISMGFTIELESGDYWGAWNTWDEALAAMERLKSDPLALSAKTTVHSFPITDAMRSDIAQNGQPLFQADKPTGPKGSVQVTDDAYLINLFERADASTPFHEFSHVYLLEMMNVVQSGAATPEMTKELNRIMAWLGVGDVTQIGREQHEQFARGFEAYLMEGKAPEADLIPAFKRYARWLKSIYKHVKSLGVNLTPEIRGVFDRMLATEAKVEATLGEVGLQPMTDSEMKALGVLPEDKEYLDKLYAGAQDEAERSMFATITKGIKSRMQKWRKDANEAADNNPLHANVRGFIHSEGIDKATAISIFGADVVERMPAGLDRVFKGSIDADELALGELQGYRAEAQELLAAAREELARAKEFRKPFLNSVRVSDAFAKDELRYLPSYFKTTRASASALDQAAAENQMDEVQDFLDFLLGLDQSVATADADIARERDAVAAIDAEIALQKEKGVKEPQQPGMHPDEAAYVAGFNTATELIEALEAYVPRKQEIANYIAQQKAEFESSFAASDFIFDTEEFAEYLGVMGNYTSGKMNEEAKYDARLETIANRKKGTPARGASQPVMARSAFKSYAKKLIRDMPIRDAVRADLFMAAVKKAASVERVAIKKSDWAAAQKANEQMRLNFEMAKESRKIRLEKERFERLGRRIKKGDPKKVSAKYLGAALKLAERFGMVQLGDGHKPITDKAGKIRDLLSVGTDEMGPDDFGFDLFLTDSTAPFNYKDMSATSVEELRTLLNALIVLGRDAIDPRLTSLNITMEEAKTDLVAASEKLKDKKVWKKRGRSFFGIDPVAWMRKVQDKKREAYADTYQMWAMIRILDGFTYYTDGEPGPYEVYFRDNLEKAYARKSKDVTYYTPKIRSAFAKLFAGRVGVGAPVWIDVEGVAVPRPLAADGRELDFEAIASAVLNMGNESNLLRLKEGYGWNDEQLNSLLNVLNDAELDAVQEIWDIFEEMRPEFFAVSERINGVAPPRIEPRTFTTPSGKVMRGGYVPAYYEHQNVKAAQLDEQQLMKESANAGHQRPSVNSRSAKSRAVSAGGMPIRLDFSGIARQFDYNLQYTAFAETIRDLARVLNNQEVADTIAEKVGHEWLPTMRIILSKVATPGVEANTKFFGRLMRGMGTAASKYILGGNRSVGIKQTFSIPAIYVEGGSWHKGLGHIVGSPRKMYSAWQQMMEESPAMRQRMEGGDIDREVVRQRKKLIARTKLSGVPTEIIDAVLFAYIRFFDGIAVFPAYYGTKQNMERKYGPGQRAIRETEKIIFDTQPMSRNMDLSALQLDRNGLSRLLTFFSGFVMKFENRKRVYVRGFLEGKIPIGQFMFHVLLERMAPPMLMNLLFTLGAGDDPELDDVLWDMLLYQVCGFPGVRELAVLGANTIRRAYDPDFQSWSVFNTPLLTPAKAMERNMNSLAGWFQGDIDNGEAALAALDVGLALKGVPAVKMYEDMKESARQFERSDGFDAWFKLLFKPDPEERE